MYIYLSAKTPGDTTSSTAPPLSPPSATPVRNENNRINRAGACERAGGITRVDATWNAARRGTHTEGAHTGDPHRGDPHRGPTQGARTGEPHRGPIQRGGPHRGPTTEGEGHTGDPHRTHTDIHGMGIYIHIHIYICIYTVCYACI